MSRFQRQGSVLVGVGVALAGLAIVAALLLRGMYAPDQEQVAQSPTVLAVAAEDTVLIPGMPACSPTFPPTDSTAPSTAAPATPEPTATATPAPVFGLAWFHKPPDDGTTPKQLAQAHRYVHLTSLADIEYRHELRDAGYKGPVYTYITANAVEGPGPYRDSSEECEAGYEPLDNTLAWDTDDFCRYVHAHESWFLHNGDGERLAGDYFGSGRWTYLMNPADPGWQAFSQERLAFMRDNWGYDGVWLDNVDLDLDRPRTDVENADGQVREFANDAEWRAGMARWLAGVRGKVGEWPMWANIVGGGTAADSWDSYAPYLDGAMDESFSVRWIDEWRTPEQWRGELERASRWLASGKGLVMVGQGPREDEDRLRFSLASYMLVAEGEQAFFRYTRFDSYYNSLWLYPEYDTARLLGAPTGPREEVAPGVWRRNFTNGTVEVDLNVHEGRIVLKRET
ncbi:MAG: putative glycoside hydrolase [Chloroflexota bacterium]|nr:putative glycoside hydrolase [Chloroflexota bacterium]MDQ5866403.1 putative glycoside hydrolase [Chloroflexota bacterium]